MDSPIFVQWQQWENRIQEWLNRSTEDTLDLANTTSFERMILSILSVKYKIVYQNLNQENSSTVTKKHSERIFNVRLSRNKLFDLERRKERDRDKLILFVQLTSRYLTPEQMNSDTSPEWQELNELCDWHGSVFLQRFRNCLLQFLRELIFSNPAYREFISQPVKVPAVPEIINQIYEVRNDGKVFLSVDMKSANFSMLQYIHTIDAQMYPTWADFLSVFVGTRPIITNSKKLRMDCFGDLPERHKLHALYLYYTTNIYQTTLRRCLTERNVDVECAALTGDEVVFHLDDSIDTDKICDLVKYVQSSLDKESPLVRFVVQAYRIRAFNWQQEHLCFARLFIGNNGNEYDLKCVPHRDRNYDQACHDFRKTYIL